jgi:hypothetical protein
MCGPWFSRMGLAHVFQSVEHDVIHWYSEQKSAHDIFNENPQIDLFIGQTYTCGRALKKLIKQRPEMKVILQSSTWGLFADTINREKYPILFANDYEKKHIEELKKETGKPDFVFLHYDDKWIEPCLGHWNTIGVKPIGLMNAADTFTYMGGEIKQEYISDINYIGGRWPYKSQSLDKYILPLCNNFTAPHKKDGSKITLKVFGNQGWQGTPQFLGSISEDEAKHVFASSRVGLNVSEPHSQALGFDCVERPHKYGINKVPVISDRVSTMADIFGDTIAYYDTYEDLKQLILQYLEDDDLRVRQGKALYELVTAKHTYFDRVAKLLNELNMPDEVSRVMEKKHEYIQESVA